MRVVLDACVLYPTVLREILIAVADAGLYQPVWSDRILAEWRHAAGRLGPDQDAVAGAEIALLRDRFPGATVADDGSAAAGFDWPDAADRHVVEAALAAGATGIVTANLRDFPRRAMAALALDAIHPDAFLTRLFHRAPDPVRAAVTAAHDKARALGGPMPLRDMMARARLPRLAKAMARTPG